MLILLTLTTAFAQDLQLSEDLTISGSSDLFEDFDFGDARPRGGQVNRIVNGETTADYQAVGSFVTVYNDDTMAAFCSGRKTVALRSARTSAASMFLVMAPSRSTHLVAQRGRQVA